MTKYLLSLFFLLAANRQVNAISQTQMYPYGTAEGDNIAPLNDDGYITVGISFGFPFFGGSHTQLTLDTNGVITLGVGMSQYTPSQFPLFGGVKTIAAFWADVDTSNGGDFTVSEGRRIFYREVDGGSLLDVATSHIRMYYPTMSTFRASYLFIATWDRVTYFYAPGHPNSQTNTFQCVLITDGIQSFSLYQYLDINWVAGDDSGGINGLGGTPAQVGFDAGDGVNFYAIPESRTADVINLDRKSNLNPPMAGRYMFQINSAHIQPKHYHLRMCTAVTDPHFRTFDGDYYSPQPSVPGRYLAAAPKHPANNTRDWNIWFSTTYWYTSPYTCVGSVEVDIDGLSILMGMNGVLEVNGVRTYPPFYFPNQLNHSITVSQMGANGHLLTTTTEMLRVSFTGDMDYKMVIEVPEEIYLNDLTGYCGNFNNDPNDDHHCDDGVHNDINNCYVWPDHFTWGPNTNKPTSAYSTESPVWNPSTSTWDPWSWRPESSPADTTSSIMNPSSATQNPWNIPSSSASVLPYSTTGWNPANDTTQVPWRSTRPSPVWNPSTATWNTQSASSAWPVESTYPPWSTQKQTSELTTEVPSSSIAAPTAIPDPQCTGAELESINIACGIIIAEAGPFRECIERAPNVSATFHNACVYDLCAIAGLNYTAVICHYLESYAAACMRELSDVTLHWRTEDLCPPSCPAHSEYMDCASSCVATCGNPHADIYCPLPCRGSCQCDAGYVFEQGSCIAQSSCGCQDNAGNYHPNDHSWVTPDCLHRCQCSGERISCSQLPACASNAHCYVMNATRDCFCDSGFTGDGFNTCLLVDYCNSSSCDNGGTCTNVLHGYTCSCPEFYEGTNCQHEIDFCLSDPCQNGGTCRPGLGGFTCACLEGWTGEQCGSMVDHCDPNPCYHNGTCANGFNGFTCSCVEGWTGERCGSMVDHCDPNPCHHNGTCANGLNGFTCSCLEGWTGERCGSMVDHCDPNPCHHNGTCANGLNGFTCSCVEGWTGERCGSMVDHCDPNPCDHNGTCANGLNGFNCSCLEGWTGERCGSMVDHCHPNPCGHESACSNSLNGYTCSCVEFYEGPNCDHPINFCQSHPCMNGATCNSRLDGFSCECAPGYVGKYCADLADPCYSNPCMNGGTCMVNSDHVTYECLCPPGYEDNRCAYSNPCASSPCASSAQCVDTGHGTYSCQSTQCSPACPSQLTCANNSGRHSCQCADSCTFSCTDQSNGNYMIPDIPCTEYYFSCSNGYLYVMPCPSDTVFLASLDKCVYRYQIPNCT